MATVLGPALDYTLGQGFYNITVGAIPTVSSALTAVGGDVSVVWESVKVVAFGAVPLGWSLAKLGVAVIANPFVVGLNTALGVGIYKLRSAYAKTLTHKFTTDLIQLAKEGKLSRAYGRDPVIDNITEGLQRPGFVILVGDSGVGKSAIVEELACRIHENKIENLKGARVVRFNLRDAEGGVGLQDALNEIFFGGLEKSIRILLQEMERSNGSGKTCILFIDEIQDLLSREPELFDRFKVELARGDLKIIGATTDAHAVSRLRNRKGTGAGLARRIEEVTVPAMSAETTVEVIRNQAADLTKEYQQKGFQLEFNDDFYEAAVVLSTQLFGDIPYPNRAANFLLRICLNAYNYKNPNKLGAREVVDFVAARANKRVEDVQTILDNHRAVRLSAATFQRLFFPRQEPLARTTQYVERESQRLFHVLTNHPGRPWMVLNGEAAQLQVDLIANWSKSGKKIYCCDLMKLVRSANTREGNALVRDLLEQLAKDKNAVLVLENCKPGWVAAAFPATKSNPAVVQSLVRGIENTKIGRSVQQGLSRFGINTSDLVEDMSASVTTPPEESPDIVAQVFEFIKQQEVPSVIVQSRGEPIELPSWNSRSLDPVKLEDIVDWLNSRYQAYQANAGKAITTDNPWIAQLVFTLYQLKDPSIPGTALDLAEKVVAQMGVSDAHIIAHLSQVLDGHKTIQEIDTAWNLAEQQNRGRSINPVVVPDDKEPPVTLRAPLHHLISSSQPSVVWITEESRVRRQSLTDQLAAGLQAMHASCFQLDYASIKRMPPLLKKLVLERDLSTLKETSVVVIDEEALSDETVMKQLTTGSCKIVCFKAPQKEAPAPSFMSQFMQQGLNTVKQQFGLPMASRVEGKNSLFVNEFEYVPGAISDAELRAEVEKRLQEANVPKELRLPLQNLYLYLVRQPNSSIDQVFDYLSRDLSLYDRTSIGAVCDKFKEFYGQQFGLSLNGVKYEVKPQLASTGYRIYRAAAWTLSNVFFVATYPIRQAAWLISAVVKGVGRIVVGSAAGWAQKRILKT